MYTAAHARRYAPDTSAVPFYNDEEIEIEQGRNLAAPDVSAVGHTLDDTVGLDATAGDQTIGGDQEYPEPEYDS